MIALYMHISLNTQHQQKCNIAYYLSDVKNNDLYIGVFKNTKRKRKKEKKKGGGLQSDYKRQRFLFAREKQKLIRLLNTDSKHQILEAIISPPSGMPATFQ